MESRPGMEYGGAESSEPQPETEEAVRQRFVEELRQGYSGRALTLKEKHNFSQEFLGSPEVQEAAARGLAIVVDELMRGGGEMYGPVARMKEIVTSEARVVEAVKSAVVDSLNHGLSVQFWKIKVPLGEKVIEAVIKLPEVQEAGKQALVRDLEGPRLQFKAIMEDFGWHEEDALRFQKKAKGSWLSRLRKK